jgi:tRNA dimethylallyltransferase
MLIDSLHDALVLTGPTASGKTELGLELAEQLNAEIISMDSMAVYRGMDVGTAKPSLITRRRVLHHLIDVLEPWESGSVAWWLQEAERAAREIASRGRRVLFVGGTPLYLKALLYGLFQGPSANLALRKRFAEEARLLGSDRLFSRLVQVDPTAACRVHRNDLRRIIRALEVWEVTGRPISTWQREWRDRTEDENTDAAVPRVLWLDLPRDTLYARIDERVRHMFTGGLVDEVRTLCALPRQLSREAGQAVGYKEVREYLEGKRTFEGTLLAVQARTRHFAKRQITWFRHIPECRQVTRELTFSVWGSKMNA